MTKIETAKYHPTVKRLINMLEKAHVEFETFEHEEVRTSAEASKVRDGYTEHQGAKAILVKITGSTKEAFKLLVIPGDMKFSTRKVRKLLRVRDVRFARPEEIDEITGGVKPGGIPPFGNLFDIETIADPKVLENERIVFNAGDRRFSIGMRSKDYRTVAQPRVADITQETPQQ